MIKYDYVKINHEKIPTHSLELTFTYDDIKDLDNVAILVKEPYVVLDVDNEDHFNVLCEIIKDKKIKTRILKTDRGGHFWFKSRKSLQNNVNINTPITLRTDIKSWGKKSLVTVKRRGVWRKWLQEDENIDELPFWLLPIKTNKDFYNMKEGDGRDPALFSYIIPLMNLGFTKEQIMEIFDIINNYVFSDPLKQSELNKMFEGNDIFEKKNLCFFNGKTFLHNVFVDWLLDTHFFKSYGRQVYVYKNGLYQQNDDEIYRKMLEQVPFLRKTQLNEAYENLRLKVTMEDDEIDPLVVNVKNGIYDLRENKFKEHSPYVFTVNQLNCVYNPNAKCKEVDDMLDSLTQYNKLIRTLLEDMLGYLLIGDCRFQQAFLLLGNGANGKSKFLEMIMNWVGHDNCSSLALEDLSERFRTSQLVGKIANIGDDSGSDLLKNTAIFKKIVTGDSITVEYKHGQPFSFNNKAKLLFSANNLPPSSDKSDGFFRRMIIIPFNAVFRPGMARYDPNIGEKLSTEEARSYLLNIAIRSAQKILLHNRIEIPEEVKKMVSIYEMDNNNVLQWLFSGSRRLNNRPAQEVYTEYCLYCNQINSIPVKMPKFNQEVIKKNPECKLVEIKTKDGTRQIVWKKTI